MKLDNENRESKSDCDTNDECWIKGYRQRQMNATDGVILTSFLRGEWAFETVIAYRKGGAKHAFVKGTASIRILNDSWFTFEENGSMTLDDFDGALANSPSLSVPSFSVSKRYALSSRRKTVIPSTATWCGESPSTAIVGGRNPSTQLSVVNLYFIDTDEQLAQLSKLGASPVNCPGTTPIGVASEEHKSQSGVHQVDVGASNPLASDAQTQHTRKPTMRHFVSLGISARNPFMEERCIPLGEFWSAQDAADMIFRLIDDGGVWGDRHLCGDDVYDVSFSIKSANEFNLSWTINGPHKEGTQSQTFRRIG
eukprot:Selendium_serpulae@DN2194_c0_g1_i1.p1